MTSAQLVDFDTLEALSWAESMAGREAPIVNDYRRGRARLVVGCVAFEALIPLGEPERAP